MNEICNCGHAKDSHTAHIVDESGEDIGESGCIEYCPCLSFTARPDEPKGDKDATLANLRIDTPQDIQHYGNNALAILFTTVATIKHVYSDPGSNMPARVERMETALAHLQKIIDQSSSQLQAERSRREKCSDCEKTFEDGQQLVFVGHGFIVHQTCLDRVEAEWEVTKAALRADGHNVDDCGWRERYGITQDSTDTSESELGQSADHPESLTGE